MSEIPGTGVLIAELPDGRGLCTASLLGSRTLLTAAHCVEFENARYYFSTEEGVPRDLSAANPVLDIFIHPSYVDNEQPDSPEVRLELDGSGFDLPVSSFDLAIVHLTRAESAPPLRLATEAPAVGAVIELVGRGQTEPDRAADGRTRVGQNTIHSLSTDGFAYLEATGAVSNVCQGDSGGPSLNPAGEIIGVHSLGTCTLIERVGIWPFHRDVDVSIGFDAAVNTAADWIAPLIVDEPLRPPNVSVLTSNPSPMIGETVTVDIRWDSEIPVQTMTVIVDGYIRREIPYSFQSETVFDTLRLELDELRPRQSQIDVEVLDWAGQLTTASAAVEFLAPPEPDSELPTSGGCAGTEGALWLFALRRRRRAV
ncbi:MAG: S1 family peptidase [Myxococcota bacterium]